MGTHFCNLYKPPHVDFEIMLFPKMPRNFFVCRDFDSCNTAWGYPNTNKNEKLIFEWLESHEQVILYNSKDNPTFYSGSHKSWTYLARPVTGFIKHQTHLLKNYPSKVLKVWLLSNHHLKRHQALTLKPTKEEMEFQKSWLAQGPGTHKQPNISTARPLHQQCEWLLLCFLLHVTLGGKTLHPQGQKTPVYSMLGWRMRPFVWIVH